jgi:hypothetical protein
MGTQLRKESLIAVNNWRGLSDWQGNENRAQIVVPKARIEILKILTIQLKCQS